MSRLTVACVQMCAGRDIAKNVETASDLIRKAAGKGARYIQTPEMTHLVERNRQDLYRKISIQKDDFAVQAFQNLAKELEVILHIGSLAIARDDGKVANRAFMFGPDGALLSTYDKIHMFDVDLDHGESWRESNTYEPGTCSPVVKTPLARFGLAICYDLRFPTVFRAQSISGADILTVPACFTRQTGKAHWHVLLRARAIENAAFVIAAAQGGNHDDGRETFGHSLIIDPWGTILAEADNDAPGVIYTEIDLENRQKALKRIPVLSHVRDFDTPVI